MDENFFNHHFYSKWDHFDWKHWTDPSEIYQLNPTFVIGEYLFIFLSILSFIHAITRKNKLYYLIGWICTISSGIANDAFFMWLPFVDNFWHSQASIMITPRLPLYIPCLYNVTLYFPLVAVLKLNLSSRIQEGLIGGILGELMYSSFDIIGAKYLWWTWLIFYDNSLNSFDFQQIFIYAY
eukprot:TRINITY_DN356_c0_g1_i2.p1 TRINITY_DN356_c0_g1~~TRINITY_DN356_c0_g1_i2.p1  ORF type:complete len:181 (-),score=25.37 TRINITY_DN356_c0_g1_i2:41-583(-)